MKPGGTKEQRRIDRKEVTGDILWSYATNPLVPQYEGTLVDVNKFGLGMLSQKPVREASILRIYAKDLWKGAKYATVMWCEEIAPNTYKSGLLFNVPTSIFDSF
jgi:hypothetical protein